MARLLQKHWRNWRHWLVSKITFAEDAWEEYLYWQSYDKQTLRRINGKDRLVYEIQKDSITILQCRGHYDDK